MDKRPDSWPSRDTAERLLQEFTEGQNLRQHAYAVEAVMRFLARRFGEDEEFFGLVGLLHDFDYERWPNLGEHTVEGGRILASRGYPAILIEAIQSHVTENGIPRDTLVKKAIYASDELTGFVVAVALVKGRDLSQVTVASVEKKLKDKGFARAVNREDVLAGPPLLGLTMAEHIAGILEALGPVAARIGLTA